MRTGRRHEVGPRWSEPSGRRECPSCCSVFCWRIPVGKHLIGTVFKWWSRGSCLDRHDGRKTAVFRGGSKFFNTLGKKIGSQLLKVLSKIWSQGVILVPGALTMLYIHKLIYAAYHLRRSSMGHILCPMVRIWRFLVKPGPSVNMSGANEMSRACYWFI
jgi:hypothetical protein